MLRVPASSTTPGHISFHLKAVALADRGLYTCRYQLSDQQIWSSDSEPIELLLNDGKLDCPGLRHTPEARRATASLSVEGEREERPWEGSPSIGGLWLGPNPYAPAQPQFHQLRMGH